MNTRFARPITMLWLLVAACWLGSATPASPQIIINQYPPGVYPIGTNLIWSITNGPHSFPIYVVATTNLAVPLTNWVRVATNSFDQNGKLVLILPMEPGKPRRFYGLELAIY